MNTSELQGAALDWAVATCEGIELIGGRYDRLLVDGHMSRGQEMMAPYKPSTDWAQGGPIIEREEMTLACNWLRPFATKLLKDTRKIIQCSGDTPLIAAMRCYVASKLGDTIELPEELK